ncbi:DISEASE RESISTANCE PROTEIN RP [Salix viminalis]|uniref:DISEASE RESISTANCE PROTEIN RP n=1 Tax=Salix viminalis TaxID=40686 RepID=A0A9Q0TLS3_SALVM|nr:DISEASE RESISTANCE PROTEIN RP [Salix viminalis]
MAAALVGGSILSAFLQVLFDRMASREILDFFKERKLNDRLLKKLKIMMISVRIAFSSSKREKDEMEKLGEILDRLEYLAQQKDALGLREGMGEKTSLEKIPTTSLVDDIDVCGRDHDKEAILKLLLLEDDNSSKISKKARHLSFARRIHDDGTMILKGACEARFLRTLLLFNRSHWQQGRHIGNGVMNNLFLTLKCLRALSLSPDHDVVGLPNSIGDLKHLRYLSLSATSVVRLPDSVSTLYNLQTLLLHECNDLIELPASMMKLINLCHLDITKTKLQEMPSQLGKLTKLHKLTDFFLGKQSGSSINELGKLQHLRGTLRIWNLQNVMDARNAIKANLKGKQLLKELELTWKGFPDWIGDSSFSNIVSLKLIGCKYCSSLPPLGQLVSLKDLLIKELGEIMVVGPEFYGSCTSMRKPFGSLEILTFEGMLKWHEWFFYSEDDVGGAFPRLQKLYMKLLSRPNKSPAQLSTSLFNST